MSRYDPNRIDIFTLIASCIISFFVGFLACHKLYTGMDSNRNPTNIQNPIDAR